MGCAGGMLAIRLLMALACLAAASCSAKPPDSVLDDGIRKAVVKKVQIFMPMYQNVSTEVLRHEVTNSYQRGEVWYYEYSAEARITTTTFRGKKETKTQTVGGTVLFEKRGKSWYSDMVD